MYAYTLQGNLLIGFKAEKVILMFCWDSGLQETFVQKDLPHPLGF